VAHDLVGTLTVTSVDPVSGEELASGELLDAATRRATAFRAVRGESITSGHPELAARISDRLRALDGEHGRPVRARFEITGGNETLASVEPAPLSPSALVRVLAERVRDGRLARDAALARITPVELEATGTFMLGASRPAPFTHGLAASGGAASGKLALPADFEREDPEPRVLVIDDASPEDASAIRACVAIVATAGGLTADAAIAARALRKPCVVSTPLRLSDRDGAARGHWVTVDGSTGNVYLGALPTTWTPATPFAAEVLAWLAPEDDERPSAALVRAQRATAQAAPT
jgi:pyruvate,orthophosphate dikinase